MKEVINSRMIILAREARAMNQLELAEKMRMSATNLSKIERGDIYANREALESIAAITGFPSQFFQQPGNMVPEYLGYRKRQNVAHRKLASINAMANIIRLHVQFLVRELGIEKPGIPSIPVQGARTPSSIAANLRRHWKLDRGPVSNMTLLLEEKGIAISSFDFGTERVDCRSLLTDDGYPIIFLNNRLLGDRQRFSLAYELGQLVMHRSLDLPVHRDVVHEANEFAAELLMPARDISPVFRKGITLGLLGEMKKTWKVSMIALLYRADDLGFVTPNQKRYLLQQFNSMKIRRREPLELDIVLEKPALLGKWINEYRQIKGLGITEMAALLCMNADEFMELYS